MSDPIVLDELAEFEERQRQAEFREKLMSMEELAGHVIIDVIERGPYLQSLPNLTYRETPAQMGLRTWFINTWRTDPPVSFAHVEQRTCNQESFMRSVATRNERVLVGNRTHIVGLKGGELDGHVLAVPNSDTIIRAESNGQVVEYAPRDEHDQKTHTWRLRKATDERDED